MYEPVVPKGMSCAALTCLTGLESDIYESGNDVRFKSVSTDSRDSNTAGIRV